MCICVSERVCVCVCFCLFAEDVEYVNIFAYMQNNESKHNSDNVH